MLLYHIYNEKTIALKVYYDKRKGKWRAATHCEPKDVLLCTLVPAALLFFGIYLTKKYFVMRKEEKAAAGGSE